MANYTGIIRCHPDAGVLDNAPSLMFTWDISMWWNLDLAADYATDIPLLGTPEILGTSANLFGMVLVYMLMSTRDYSEYHANAKGCFQVPHHRHP